MLYCYNLIEDVTEDLLHGWVYGKGVMGHKVVSQRRIYTFEGSSGNQAEKKADKGWERLYDRGTTQAHI